MDKNVFEEKVKPILTYIGLIGAILTSIAYMVMVIVLIKGFEVHQAKQVIVFAVANAIVGLLVAGFLKYQGTCFAKNLPENKAIIGEYYRKKTRNGKKNHSLNYFWITTTIKDIIFKGVTVACSTLGLIYIVIVGSNDWSMLGMAIVNLILFICFGLLALNQAYEYYNNIYVNYMKENIIKEEKNGTDNRIESGRPSVEEPARHTELN